MKNFSPKLISIIMPCFNAENFIENSVGCVLNQSYKNLELIVVDDGSTDNSASLLSAMQKTDNRLKVFYQQNKGAGPARNKALSESKGDYIAFLDADDYWTSSCLERLGNALENELDTDLGLAYCGWQNIGLSYKQSQPFIPPDYSSSDLTKVFLGGCRWPIHAVLFHRACIEKVNGFNEQWTSCMDYDLWLKMSPFLKVIRVPEVMAFYRHHEKEQITKNRVRVAKNHWMVQQDFLSHHQDIASRIGKKEIERLTKGELLHRAYICYWERDLAAAHQLFRMVMKTGYGNIKDWKYMIPAFLPLSVYKKVITLLSKN